MSTTTPGPVTNGTVPAANRTVVTAELRRAVERQDRKQDSRNLPAGPSRVLLLRAAPEWLDEPRLTVSGLTGHDSTVTANVAGCPTVLAVLDALATRPEDGYLVILTPCDDDELGDSVLARVIANQVHTISRWDLVLDAFGARRRGLGLNGREQPWLAGALLDAQPSGGWGKVSGPVLTLDSAMNRLVGVRFGISDGRDDAVMDAAALLEWTRNEFRVASFRRLPADERAGLADWLRESVGPVAWAVFALLEHAEVGDAVPLGLALRGLTEPGGRRRAQETARVRAEERFFGGHSPGDRDLREFSEAAESLIGRWSDGPHAGLAGELCVRAEQILAELGAGDLAATSQILDAGFEARLAGLADVLTGLLPDPRPIDLRGAEDALDLATSHIRSGAHEPECAAAQAAVSLARWLAVPEAMPGTLADSAKLMLRDWAWADRALAVVAGGGHGRVPKLAAAYAKLCETVVKRRAGLDRRFARKLAAWTETSSSTDELLLVENVLDRVARPVAERRLPLIVVLDGMSTAVGSQIAEDIIAQRRWVEVGRREDGRESALATVPSITSISRTSLLCGKLRTGGQAEENAGFAAFWRPRATRLFHKGDLPGVQGTGLNRAVRDAIHDPAAVVGVVLNTVDDSLDRGREGDAPQWRLTGIRYLGDLLDEAARAGRPVILTSDHGHLPDRGAPVHEERSAAARYRTGTPGPGELTVRGLRVLAADGEVVAAWDEQIRYTPRKAGYHGGAAPSEVVVPVLVFIPSESPVPRGWHVLDPVWHPPTWWSSALPDSITAEAAEPADDALFGVGEMLPGRPAVSVPSAPALGSQVTGSALFAAQRKLARRPPEAGQVASLIDRLAEAGGKIPVTVAAEATGEPPFRMSGYLAQVARLLNADGYAVIGVTDQGRTVELNIELLRQQFLTEHP
ncbi:MAG: BREX-2 system phosphatase PglZ [Streptosporangiaceae bacterium]|nr:BREX-2 system phosphatase PglZ [Streptosporangiaceae bacterium]MBV9853173.1 BREX-2 system phosphatase PglZ [Streptosporangiaceae bacterium]